MQRRRNNGHGRAVIRSLRIGFLFGSKDCELELNENIIVNSEQKFSVGTKIRYSCYSGFTREFGSNSFYNCVNDLGVFKWKPVKEAGLQCTNRGNKASAINNQRMEFDVKNITVSENCGPVPDIPNARLFSVKYPLGEKLHYKDVTSGLDVILKCLNCSGTISGIILSKGCTDRTIEPSVNQTIRVVTCRVLGVIILIFLFLINT
ncbi:hypothetical protein GDO86_006007 [Hymenochirus boettgeri]|uniref:Sushi domain-containing protein n=1 Tax=Hymenochirus boettgeri TaxID=247094 RepID=A0A8T2J4A5_9PIPI|nr:hypothetical protein GDO86_006007 [Hymenochirus boettgeri]